MRFLLVAMVGTAAACGAKNLPDVPISQGLPPWMEDGDEVRLGVANKWLDIGYTAGALHIVSQMRAEGSESPELDLLQGRALLEQGVDSEAERLLVAATAKMNRDPRPHSELCWLYAQQDKIADAITSCERAVRLGKTDAKAWNNLAFLLLAEERLDEAKEAAEQAITLNPNEAKYRNNLGLVQAALGKSEQANRVLQSTMTVADAAYWVGATTERFHGPDEARPWYERAVEANPDHRAALAKLDPETPDGADDVPVEEP